MVLAFLMMLAQPSSAAQPANAEASAILAKAIGAAGGAEALARARVFEWRGRATVHAGDRQIRLEGRWIIEPPDNATVETWDVERGLTSTRRLIVKGHEGLMERDGKRMPMPAEMLANERDQFYLYSVLKLVPLLDRDVTLTVAEASGAKGLTVTRPGRANVTIFFNDAGRPTRLRTMVFDPASKQRIEEELQFEGDVESAGVRWPRRIRILQSARLFFELEITEFSVTQ